MKKAFYLLLASLLLLTGIDARAQRIENSSHSTIGYIQNDGRVENSSHSTIGYFSDSRFENGSHSTIGYYSSGRFENSSHSTIGYYPNSMKREWVAFFFFFMNR